MRILSLLACVLSALPIAAQSQPEFPNRGVIYGTATSPDGTPAKGLILNAEPLGHPLAFVLPRTETNEVGAFRFENLPLGRYTVFAEDKRQGYSSFSTRPAGQGNLQEVELTSEHPEAEFNLHLPPKAGFLILRLRNQKNGAAISEGEVTVMSADNPPRLILSGSSSSAEPVLVPSNKNLLLLHVTSWGFHEWDQSAGKGKPIRIAPGDRLTLDVLLDPANPLRARIPDADPRKYHDIRDAKDWKNPYLIVRPDGIIIFQASGGGNPIPVDSVPAALESLPDSAWAYGLVVAVQDNGIVGSQADESQIQANRNSLVRVLSQLGVMVDLWPSG